MDPDRNLAEQRELALRGSQLGLSTSDWERLAELVLELDSWLRHGGFPPHDWTPRGDRMTYRILRYYFERPGDADVIATGLTLEEAQAHTNDPETSSSTATNAKAQARTAEHGPWFDGYAHE